MDLLSFRIPDQIPPTKDSFDFRPQALDSWIAELPMGDTGEAARRLYAMLQETNRLEVAPAQRAEMLEKVAPSVESVLNSLLKHYTGLSFPLPQKPVRIAQFASRLATEMVIAYQGVLNARENVSWLFRMTHHHLWVLSIHRMMVYLERIIATYRIIHRPYPSGVWLALHQLYKQAQQHGRLSEKIAVPGKATHRSSIRQEYKRALLLSLLEPQLFRRSQMGEVLATMGCWIDEVRLAPVKGLCGERETYCIRLDMDAPYTMLTAKCNNECDQSELGLELDTSDLYTTLNKAIERVGDAEQVTLQGCKVPVSMDTLQILRQCWQPPSDARSERKKSDSTVQAALGMSAIHVLLSRESEAEGASGISDQVIGEVLRAHEKPMATHRGEGSEAQVWDSIFYGTELGYNAWAMDAEEKNYQFVQAHQINYTESGRCLSFDKNGVESLQVGELIGVRDREGQRVQLFMVRWLQEDGESINVGLMRLATEVEPVLVMRHQGDNAEVPKTGFGCLLGIGEDRHPQLFLPYLPGNHEERFYLVVDNRELPLTLYEKVSLSPLFEGVHFAVADALCASTGGEQMPLEEVNSRLHSVAQSVFKPESWYRDDFSDVWESL